MIINHYSSITRSLGALGVTGLLTLCFIESGWILIALFFLPFLVIFSLWTFFDSTKITSDGDIVIIKLEIGYLLTSINFTKTTF